MQGGSGAHALAKALRPTTHRLSAADARLLEESLRFGATRLFVADLDSSERASGAEHAVPCTSGAARTTTSSAARAADAPAAATPKPRLPDSAERESAAPTAASAVAAAADVAPRAQAAPGGGGGGEEGGIKKEAPAGSDTQSLEAPEGGHDPVEQPGSHKDGAPLLMQRLR